MEGHTLECSLMLCFNKGASVSGHALSIHAALAHLQSARPSSCTVERRGTDGQTHEINAMAKSQRSSRKKALRTQRANRTAPWVAEAEAKRMVRCVTCNQAASLVSC